ncbi:MAG: ATP synthase F1 subunit delta [Nitrospinales bacterium]
MIEHIIGKRYAHALSATFPDDSGLEEVLRTVKTISGAFETEPRLIRFFAHPGIPGENKIAMVGELCGRVKANKDVKSLLTLLVKRKKILYLKNIAEHFETVVDKRLRRVRAGVVSARPLSKTHLDRLKTSLKRITGKEVLIESTLDESLIAGVIVRVGSLVADATVKNRLAALKRNIEKEEVA